MNLQGLGKRIREKREKRNLKQIDIANALNISSQAVSKWERGENAPDITILLSLAKILGVTSDWLLGGATGEKDTFPATVLCTSINHFAKKSEEKTPKDIANWVNSIFYSLTESSLRFNGVPIKYVGDGFLCFFAGPDHADRAIKAAINSKQILNNSDVMISINSGEIYLGAIGHPDYQSSDIIGETVNKAFITLQWISKNLKSGIGFSEETLQLLTTQNNYQTYSLQSTPGINYPFNVYELII
jgi:transcriptional regulator with XRE-family HTH domain